MNLKKINDYQYVIEKEGKMNVPVKLFCSEALLEKIKQDKSLQQAMNVATLPGICGPVMVMPDAHQGYGFSIGGVTAFDVKEGIITPGGIGFDINCGVRLLTTPLTKEDIEPKVKELLDSLFNKVPPGVGSHTNMRLSDEELEQVLENGSKWAIEKGFGFKEDLECTEESGTMKGADANTVSHRAKSRGRNQLGTLGSGNHFLEIQYVDKIFNPEIAKAFGIEKEGQVTIMIHCGSRGLGHQVCSDYIRQMEEMYPDIAKNLPDRDLIHAPVGSKLAEKYFKAMCAAANFAWCNRQLIAHRVRESLKEVMDTDPKKVKQVYDVAHNIAKLEEHEFDGVMKQVYLHRKGATRAFPPGHPDLPERYQKTGQPILIPGSMGTSSYVLVGTEKGMKESLGSTAHGAGRVMSRHEALRRFQGEQIKAILHEKHIEIKAASYRGIAEEAPGVYKDIDEVVKVSHEVGIGNLVVRVKPLGVIKG